MKLLCSAFVVNRSLSNQAQGKKKHSRSTLALCKQPNNKEFCIIFFNGQAKNGTKYPLKNNLKKVLTRFVAEGKATIQFDNPPHDIVLQADTIQLKSFLHLLYRVLEGKISEKELTLSSLAVTPFKNKDIAPTKLIITKRSDYPTKGFPRTLEILYINDINRCSLDLGILKLMKLRILDLSHNCIEFLPAAINTLPSLKELNLSNNNFGKGSPRKWEWIDGNLLKTLLVLNLSHNKLKFLPDQIIKLQNLTALFIQDNELTCLPNGIGNLRKLRDFSASNNRLTILPGTVRKWLLSDLDLTNNNFEACQQIQPPDQMPPPLKVGSLKEYAGKKVLRAKILYPPGSIPATLAKYLDEAKYCVCGKPCFDVYFRHTNILLLYNIAAVFKKCSGLDHVPIDCYYCSTKCFATVHNRNRHPVVR